MPPSSSKNSLYIPKPSIGFLNLCGDDYKSIVSSDVRLIAPLFSNSQISNGPIPKCDVLFLYCKINENGKLDHSPSSIKRVVKISRARIAVIASENDAEAYIKAIERKSDWHANIVFVLDRFQGKFGELFQTLFKDMSNGKSMLTAWGELTPNIPGYENNNNAANSGLLVEAGDIIFGDEPPGFWQKLGFGKKIASVETIGP